MVWERSSGVFDEAGAPVLETGLHVLDTLPVEPGVSRLHLHVPPMLLAAPRLPSPGGESMALGLASLPAFRTRVGSRFLPLLQLLDAVRPAPVSAQEADVQDVTTDDPAADAEPPEGPAGKDDAEPAEGSLAGDDDAEPAEGPDGEVGATVAESAAEEADLPLPPPVSDDEGGGAGDA